MQFTECATCNGEGTELVKWFIPCTANGDPIHENERIVEMHEITECNSCNGFRVISRTTNRGYANATNATKAIAARKARKCWTCNGSGKRRMVTLRNACYSCNGKGKRPNWEPNAEWNADEYGSATIHIPNQAEFAERVQIAVIKGNMTWGESFLGLGTIVSITDYGRRAEMSEADLIADFRKDFAKNSTQFTSVLTTDKRMANTILLKVSSMGMSAIAANSSDAGMRNALPPTYAGVIDKLV